ncbi:MAG: hypothetical protein WBB01_09070 [Phormidesmis sp.]
MSKELLSAAAISLTFGMFFPYIRSIQRGQTKPHVFSWVIWGLGTLIVFFAQLAGHGGLGAWPIGVSGVITSYIALLAYLKRADTLITSSDWIFFSAALSALPFWFLTSDPLWAVVTLTVTDLIGFGPTVRKAYRHPYGESVSFFALSAARNLLVIFALEHYSLTTTLFPAVVGLACVLLVIMLICRRRLLIAARKTYHEEQSR